MSLGFGEYSVCSGDCYDCKVFYVGGCIAGDDGFIPLSEEEKKRHIKINNISECNHNFNEYKRENIL